MASSDIVQYRSPLRTVGAVLTTVFLAVYVVWTVLPIFIMFVSSLKDLLEAFKLPAVGDWSGIGVFFDFSPTFKHYHNLFADLNFTVYFGNSLARRRRLGAGLGRAGLDVRLRAVADRVPRQERPVLLDHLDPHGAGGGGHGPALRHLPLGRAGRHRARPDPGLHHLQPPLRHLDPQGLLRQRALRDRGGGDVRRLHPLPGLSRDPAAGGARHRRVPGLVHPVRLERLPVRLDHRLRRGQDACRSRPRSWSSRRTSSGAASWRRAS